MGRFYFALVSSAFSESDLTRANELSRRTEAKAVVLLQASALARMVQQHIADPLTFTYQHIERTFSDTRIVRLTDIGDREPLVVSSQPSVESESFHEVSPPDRFTTLMTRWPDFEAKAKMLAEFFDYSMAYCLANPLQSASGLDLMKIEDATLNGRREATLSAFGILNQLAHEMVEDLAARPQSAQEAQRIVRRFRTLLVAPAMLSIESLYEALRSRSQSPDEFTDRIARLKAFKLDYESFARATNQHLGIEFFRPYVP